MKWELPIRVTVPFDVKLLSPNQRLHWAERAKRTKAAKQCAHWAWRAAGCPETDGAVTVSVIIRRGRRMDPDNAVACVKSVVDGLFCRNRNGYGVTPDDSEKWLRYGEVRQETGARWKNREEVEFLVTPRGD